MAPMKAAHPLPLPMRPAGFLLPTLAALALASCAAPPPPPPTASAPPPAPTEQSPPPAAPSPAPTQPVDRQTDDYAREIWYLQERAKIARDAAKEMVSAGGLSQAKAELSDASHHMAMASCMEDQAKRNVPFYQGKATCATAVSADR
jgi:hypothetical protein